MAGKKKVCRNCKLFVEGDVCPNCKRDSFSTQWQGRIFFTNAKESHIAKQMGIEENGEYAIKVR
jgi:RNA polymerase subunit RPABC4/transcription elongation factor Spt4